MKEILFAISISFLMPLNSKSNPINTTVSFELTRNFIIVQASVNGREGHFILDTGVPEIILNTRYFKGKYSGGKFYGISGLEMDKKFEIIKFNLGGFEKRTLALITDFTALEKFTGLELLGVVGNEVFNNCEVVLDYVFKEVTIYPLDKKGNPLSSKNIHQRPLDTLSFNFGKGIPYIKVSSNGVILKMIVDSGATANVIDMNRFDRLNFNSLYEKEGSLTGFGPTANPVKFKLIENLIVGKFSCPPMKTMIVNLDGINQSYKGLRVDGVLGYEFLKNFRVAINFRKKEIYLWDREFVELQWVLSNNIKSDTLVKKNNQFWP